MKELEMLISRLERFIIAADIGRQKGFAFIFKKNLYGISISCGKGQVFLSSPHALRFIEVYKAKFSPLYSRPALLNSDLNQEEVNFSPKSSINWI